MRFIPNDANVYYHHDTLTPGNVRVADYGQGDGRWMLLPEVGDYLRDFPGNMGESITVRVIDVTGFGYGRTAYRVTVADA